MLPLSADEQQHEGHPTARYHGGSEDIDKELAQRARSDLIGPSQPRCVHRFVDASLTRGEPRLVAGDTRRTGTAQQRRSVPLPFPWSVCRTGCAPKQALIFRPPMILCGPRASSVLLDSVPLHADISGFVAMKQHVFPPNSVALSCRASPKSLRGSTGGGLLQVLRGVTRHLAPYSCDRR